MVDTGLNAMTGGRIKRGKNCINNKPFMLTYSNGLADIDIQKHKEFHDSHGGYITMTYVQPESRYGTLTIVNENKVESFKEKPKGDGASINGGFFVCNPEVIDYVANDSTIFEREPLENLAKNNKLYTFKHRGFWKPIDTLRDKNKLEDLIEKGEAAWIKW